MFQCFTTVGPLCVYAWDFVFAAQTGGQSCRPIVAESLFVYNACVGVCANKVGKVYALYVIHINFIHQHQCTLFTAMQSRIAPRKFCFSVS